MSTSEPEPSECEKQRLLNQCDSLPFCSFDVAHKAT